MEQKGHKGRMRVKKEKNKTRVAEGIGEGTQGELLSGLQGERSEGVEEGGKAEHPPGLAWSGRSVPRGHPAPASSTFCPSCPF